MYRMLSGFVRVTLGRSPRRRGCTGSWRSGTKKEPGRSPRRRGCTEIAPAVRGDRPPLPAQAGMYRGPQTSGPRSGDRSPRRRGCTAQPPAPSLHGGPLPAQAGMYRPRPKRTRWPAPTPRAGGDVPRRGTKVVAVRRSPRRRGCTACDEADAASEEPLPAQAGMYRPPALLRASGAPAPRAGGDVPLASSSSVKSRPRSPRRRGCTAERRKRRPPNHPLPAQAGMYRRLR